MNCCDEYGDCTQGRDCPIRKGYGVRRCRAGEPVKDDLPVRYWPGFEEPEDDDSIDTVNAAIVLAVIAIIALIIIGGLQA